MYFILFSFLLILSSCVCTDGAASITKTIVVDQKGHGNFKSIQAAINSIPDGNKKWIQIHVNQGIYREKVNIPMKKSFIVLQGEGVSKTRIEWNDRGDTMNCATFRVFANDFVARDIAFVNSFKQPSGGPYQVAEAALVGGDRNSFYRCSFIGYQDTLCDYLGRHFFSDCWIEGAVDFIFGSAQSMYKSCVLNSIGSGWLTANSKSNKSSPTGFVFKFCTIRASGKTYLGRPWNEWSTVVFYKTYMPANIVPEGWAAWGSSDQSKTTYVEEGCTGPGSSKSRRVSWLKKLSGEQLSHFTDNRFIGPDDWLSQQP
ncbi:hypothetical protein ZIOFF_007822 [Zingiber officinale]|uniref:Pectinesterase n=1 Tax=Zingiber officinale TaxID=94328 RepID=A0A8J5HRU8_ZINOF|nr:hypothetical protein ZIOFF_007822 [Zingiber officinale]